MMLIAVSGWQRFSPSLSRGKPQSDRGGRARAKESWRLSSAARGTDWSTGKRSRYGGDRE
jgi:hypothetical protein